MPPVKRPPTAKEPKSTEGLRPKFSSNGLKDQPTPSISAITVSGASTSQTKPADNGPDYEQTATPPTSRHNSLRRKKAQELKPATTIGLTTPPDTTPSASRRSSWRKDNSSRAKESEKEKVKEPQVQESTPASSFSSRWYVSWASKTPAITKLAINPVSGERAPHMDPENTKNNATNDGRERSTESTQVRDDMPLIAPREAPESTVITDAIPENKNLDASTGTIDSTDSTVVGNEGEDGKLAEEDVEGNIKQGQATDTTTVPTSPQQQQQQTWLGWIWSAPQALAPSILVSSPVPNPADSQEVAEEPELNKPEIVVETAAEAPASRREDTDISGPPRTPPPPPPTTEPEPVLQETAPVVSQEAIEQTTTQPEEAEQPRPRSWWFWGGSAAEANQKAAEAQVAVAEEHVQEQGSASTSPPKNQTTISKATMSEPTEPVSESTPEPSETPAVPESAKATSDEKPLSALPPRPASWGFWPLMNRSTDTIQSAPPAAAGSSEVIDTPATPVTQTDKAKGKEPANAMGKIDSKAHNAVIVNPDNKGKTEITVTETGSNSVAPSAAKKELQRLHKNATQGPPNHILPSIDDCLWRKDQPRFLEKVSKFIWKKPEQQQHRHLHLATTPLRPKKAVAIGVHGFFPMRLVRTVLGEPTGTSKRFATHASNAIKRWADSNGISVEVENIALEGEGKVVDRVELLWNLLGHWMDIVREADFVFVAAHSQGAVVGMMLLAKMIEQGVVDNARVGFLAMAGINNGPFYHLPTTLLTGSAKELFEFQRSDSTVSKKYIQAIRTVLAHNTKIIYVGSIDDQLVPMESSTFQNIHHPHIFRSVFVDGRVHAPDFLSHLVGFALKLRNLGWSDHGLIRELSTPLAGSLYSGEGHSRVYDDGQVYDLAVRFALETTDMPDIPLRVDKFELPAGNTNPFFLPWSMRGLLEEPYVRSELGTESRTLLEKFEQWKPTSKVLKDVKFRLEAVRSKL